MDIEQKIKSKLLMRGFSKETLLNNRGLIGATTDETILEVVKILGIANVSKPLPTEDAKFIYSLLPVWVKNKAPEGLDPTMYGTLSKKGDDEIQERIKQIFGNVC